MRIQNILPFTLMSVCQAHNEDPYFVSTWILLSLLFIFYVIIVASSYSYMRPRFPLFLIFLCILFPPLFFFLGIYLLFVLAFYPIVEQPAPEPTRRVSRADLRNRV